VANNEGWSASPLSWLFVNPALDFLSSDAREVFIAANPRAGSRWRGGLIDELAEQLARQDIRAVVHQDLDALRAAAQESLAAGRLRAVVSAGGDGTICRLAHETPPGTPLAILPLGTENLLARHLNLSADPAQLAGIIERGCIIRQDAGAANGKLFNLMVGCGFDADVVRRLHTQRTGHIHHWSYAQPILDSILNYQYPELRVRYEPVVPAGEPPLPENEWPMLTARWVFVVNLPRYAGGLCFSSRASGTDGLLDLCSFREGSLWNGLLYLGGVYLGQHEGWKDFQHVATRRMVIEGETDTPFQIDGDPGGELPVEINILPQRLTLLVDENWAAAERARMSAVMDSKQSREGVPHG
jgi:diacylglycerol kinase family enzyme